MLVEFACLEGSIRPTFFSECNFVLMDQVILVTTFAAPFLLSMSSPGFPVSSCNRLSFSSCGISVGANNQIRIFFGILFDHLCLKAGA